MSVSRRMARWALDFTYEQLPHDVIHEAKRALVDTIGCAIGGYDSEARITAQRALRRLHGPGDCTVFGNGEKLSCVSAALINGIMARYLDYNDVYAVPVGDKVSGGHHSDMIPPTLALAERHHIGGKEFLTALVAGYELGARFIEATRLVPISRRGWHTDSRALYIMPIVAGKLLRLKEDQVVNAVGIAGSQGFILSILDAPGEPDTMAKNMRFASAACNGITAAYLAREGFTGPERVLEGDQGFIAVAAQGDFCTDGLTEFDGEFRILRNRYKPFAAESTTLGHLSCTLHLVHTYRLKPEDVETVYVRAGSRAIQHTGNPAKRYPYNKETADHSSWYVTAVALLHGRIGPEQYSPSLYRDPRILDLIDRIHLEAVPEFDGYMTAGEVEIRTRDGRILRHRVLHTKGSPENPMTDGELEGKFREMAGRYMEGAAVDRLLDRLWHVDDLTDVADLLPLLIFDSGTH